jgi:hypothetical protein
MLNFVSNQVTTKTVGVTIRFPRPLHKRLRAFVDKSESNPPITARSVVIDAVAVYLERAAHVERAQ